MQKGSIKTLFLFLGGVALLLGAAWCINPIKELRRTYDFDPADSMIDNRVASELRIPTAALSVFRSLAIDYLWIRADKLKNAGQYFDALYLSRLICDLQPNIADVWSFQAWNMAYNISVAMPNPPERWHWIESGFKLLRDEGLAANPRNPRLYHELSWIFHHKMGGISDNYHRYYKRRLAHEMMVVFGTNEITNQELSAWSAAPVNWEALRDDPNIITVIEDIKKIEPKFTDAEQVLNAVLRIKAYPNEYAPALHQYFANNRHNRALGRLDSFVRARSLRRDWKLEPQFMLELNKKYGPIDFENPEERLSLDWRLPWCQAIYWAEKGLEFAPERNVTRRNLNRDVYHSLIDLYYNGRLQIFAFAPPPQTTEREEGQEILEQQPRTRVLVYNSQDLRMFPSAYEATLDLIKEYTEAGEEAPQGFISAASYLAWEAINNLYLLGYKKTARKYYRQLQEEYPDNEDYHVSLEVFIRNKMREQVKEITPKKAAAYIDSFLRRSYYFYALRNDDLATAYEIYAQQLREAIESHFAGETDIDRTDMPSPARLRLMSMQNFLEDVSIDMDVKNLLLARLNLEKPEFFEQIMAEMEKQRGASDGSAARP